MKMAIVNAQNAGLNTSPICSFVMWNARLSGPATSPRMANTIDAVAIERQLATNSLCLFIPLAGRAGARPVPNVRAGFVFASMRMPTNVTCISSQLCAP